MKQGELYDLKRSDTEKAGEVFAGAFSEDPVWKILMDDVGHKAAVLFFQSPVRFGLIYGETKATSENLEGIAMWSRGDQVNMNLYTGLRCGSFSVVMKAGLPLMIKMMKVMTLFSSLEKDRKLNMKGRKYLYLMIIGVAEEYQGKGHGSRLMDHLIAKADKEELPIYLETATDRDVHFYEKFGFEVVKKINLQRLNLPQWEMIREPHR